MSINVHFLDKTVSFRTQTAPDGHFDATVPADDSVTRAKILKIIQSCNRLAVLSSQPQEAFARFARDFKLVGAAGGVVTNPEGEILMMQRRGRWDLPKGHIEPAEPSTCCALREVAEETGITRNRLGELICETYHAYDIYGHWELKRTEWYAMYSDGSEPPVPQHEEGIDTVQWIPRDKVGECLQKSYSTIREVMSRYDELHPKQ